MQISGNTILITGGGSGIGRGLAEEFHRAGNQVVIAGRRQNVLEEVTAANPGMQSIAVDIEDKHAIEHFAREAVERFPSLNVVINNAGIMKPEDLRAANQVAVAEQIVDINLLGPIRLTSALLPHLLAQPKATVVTVSSGLAFVPLTMTPTYCATKAAIHSWTQSLRYQLRDTSVEVIEIIPPYVQTELMGPHQTSDPRAMPLQDFIAETMTIFREHPEQKENAVKRVKFLSEAAQRGEHDQVFATMNSGFAAHD